MPKRGGRSRGGSRGGRGGGSRGGARGGGSFRSFNLSKSLKRRANKNKSAALANHDVPELMDLGADGYLPEMGRSMNTLSKRPNRRMMDEAQYTDKHMAETMAQPLRYRRVEFVKAASVYDPSKDLIELLKKHGQKDDLAQDMQKLNVQPESNALQSKETGSDLKPAPEAPLFTAPSTGDTQTKPSCGPDTDISKQETDVHQDDSLFVEESKSLMAESKDSAELGSAEAANDPDLDLLLQTHAYAIENQTGLYEAGSPRDEVMSIVPKVDTALTEDRAEIVSGSESSFKMSDSAIEEFFTIDETGDQELFEKHSFPKKPTAALLKRTNPKSVPSKPTVHSNESTLAIERDPYITVGKVMLKTLTDEFGNISTNLPGSKGEYRTSLNFSEPLDSYFEEESEDTDEEAAFEDCKAQILGGIDFDDSFSDEELPEDFADLDDSKSLQFSIDDPNDDNGQTFGAHDIDKVQNFDDYNVYVSSDDFADELLNSDEEGLEDILAFARNQKKVNNYFNAAPTETVKKVGKGKKQRLELGSHLELELRESLMEQFQYQKQSKRDKKLRKKEKRQREGIEQHDLTAKYDYSLHIQEIREEFEAFLHDASREAMSFPPLDGHGNKTISKLAGHFNMKCIRCGGNGLSLFMKVAKTKKTFRYIPAYDQIGYIMKQRPVFKRVDVKPRTQEEIEQTDGKKDRRGPKGDTVVREGDIVGGTAPEIGVNNIGRQLLEKLGWNKGEGLGALGNKGISEPLTATVKRSKTGLK
ncbi:hypothetical protein METBIDRAFT_31205 [Metschnikowia bicuspidata var. bicuspidata NRRL YB-4993]|uniref:Protein SQS1 n=1 Tax=Metschnikowia bicuspidata var. bicuspidata NRRL YB-4993 TaxID=869754 RepID=A0A1A0HEF3_9ASCO|nr:hypothetical protein METBIDRAFT_31205 [Metschnikowia bicuspidata var. bicuspidata NRRL YB-4993]OBA22283.1 hypothetical protein METBIDRAFT_31205 [Metschnikowia bicuspidata var. bicuspidata NRRL YB-4993]